MPDRVAYCLMRLQPNATRDTRESLSHSRLVKRTDVVLGNYDLIAKLKFNQLEELEEFIKFVSRTCEGVGKTSTHIALQSSDEVNQDIDGYVFVTTPIESLDTKYLMSIKGVMGVHVLLGEYDAVCEVKAEEESPIRALARVAAVMRDQANTIVTRSSVVIHESDLPGTI